VRALRVLDVYLEAAFSAVLHQDVGVTGLQAHADERVQVVVVQLP